MNLDVGGLTGRAAAVAAAVGRWVEANGVRLAVMVVVVGTVAVVAGWRRHHRALMDREARLLLPTDTFDPTPDKIRRWATALMGTRRRRDWAHRSAEGLRVITSAAGGGLVEQRLVASRRALGVLEGSVPYQVELLRPEPEAEGVGGSDALPSEFLGTRNSEGGRASRLTGWRPARWRRSGEEFRNPESGLRNGAGVSFKPCRARAELTVAPDQVHALAELALNPDPLEPIAAAMGTLAKGEAASVAIDLQPLSERQKKRARDKALSRDGERPDWLRSLVSAGSGLLNTDPLSKAPPPAAMTMNAGSKGALARLEARSETMADYDRFASGEPVFTVQLLVWADAASEARARQIVEALVVALSPMGQRAAWRRVGIPFGRWWIGGPDSPSRRRRFDHRARTGCFRPRKPSVLGQAEIAGLIKPPTMHCHADSVRRSGGLVPAPPPGLATWTRESVDVFPFGEITERGVKRWIGTSLAETLFTVMFGRAGYGKTNAALVAFLSIAFQPDRPASRGCDLRPGVCFLDPHGDALDDLKAYLIPLADRVRILDLRRRRGAAQAGWNPLFMYGRDPDEVEDIVSMMVAGFSAVLGWGKENNRAQNLLSQAVASLCQLGTQLPPHLQPNIFLIPTILTDEAWRNEILRFLTPHQREFWTSRLATQTDAKSATSPVTNLFDRLRASNAMVGLFGQSISTFDLRASMDAGDIVLLCPGGAGDKEQLVQTLFLFEMFRAATSRSDIAPEERRPFHAFVDEIQVADRGSASEYIARMLQECRKFMLRLHAMAQQPSALSRTTLAALSDNRSHLSSAAVGADSAAWLAREFAGAVEASTLTRTPRFHRIVSVAHKGTISAPFRVRNLGLIEAYGPPADRAAVDALEAVVDANMGRRPVAEVVADVDTLGARILHHLTGRRPPTPPVAPRPSAPGPRRTRPQVVAATSPAEATSPATTLDDDDAIPPMGDDVRPSPVVSIDRARPRTPGATRKPWTTG